MSNMTELDFTYVQHEKLVIQRGLCYTEYKSFNGKASNGDRVFASPSHITHSQWPCWLLLREVYRMERISMT